MWAIYSDLFFAYQWINLYIYILLCKEGCAQFICSQDTLLLLSWLQLSKTAARGSRLWLPATTLGWGRGLRQDPLLAEKQDDTCFHVLTVPEKCPVKLGKIARFVTFDKKKKKVAMGSLKVVRLSEKVSKLATLVKHADTCDAASQLKVWWFSIHDYHWFI